MTLDPRALRARALRMFLDPRQALDGPGPHTRGVWALDPCA